MKNKFLVPIAIVLLVILGFFVWQRFLRNDFDLPRGGETKKETIVIENGEVIGTQDEIDTLKDMPSGDEQQEEIEPKRITKEIMITDGVRHSVSLGEIVGGGPGKDGIPPIDKPKFIPQKEAEEWLSDADPGIAFSRDNTHRFYPYQILVWHEMVNDTVAGKRVLVTYCPLCLTGIVFDPVVQGERVEFGTSGKLWRSNLVMYDRKTDSLWPQVLGEAVVGEMTGTKLKVLASDQMRYGEWKKAFPEGQVLSRDTGAFRRYGSSPYGDYFAVTNLSLSLARPTDTRLPNDAFVFGIVINEKAKAYSVELVQEKGMIEDVFEGINIVLRYDADLDVVRMFKKQEDGTEERLGPFSAFWFSWAVAHPETELYQM